MLIRALVSAASTLWELQEDQLYDVPEPAARSLIAEGLAEEALPSDVEAAATTPQEQAVRTKPTLRKATKR